ncbi:MAG: glycosyl transferase family 1, partial [Paracoccaceae bacterium]|nr:glycosyl transferase family 1 [Paracoccaceae bacterium]
HGETGLLVDYFSPDALARQVIEVLSHPAEYAHLGPAARNHVVEHYDFLTRTAKVHVDRINSLVPNAKRIEA